MRPLPAEIPEKYRTAFREAERVVTASTKASAALSRRLLQSILREEVKVNPSSLAIEIRQFVERPGTPSHLSEAADQVRIIGNFAAHPLKDTNTGEIIEVEEQEAEWLLDVVESLFDHIFVQPTRLAARRSQIDEKIAATKRNRTMPGS